MAEESDRRYRAVQSRDARFDGQFVTAVRTTGIYCRPSCPAQTPRPENVDFYRTPAAAVAAGFRACKRCRPDTAPGSPEWNRRADLASRALRAIAAGVLDRAGVGGLADALAVSERHLHRVLVAEVGVGPLALARTRRAQTARVLLEATELSVTEVAFGAGFASIRQFNETMRAHFATTPTTLRYRRAPAPPGKDPAVAGNLTLRLARRAPFDHEALLTFLARRAVPGLESATETAFSRVLPTGILVRLEARADAVVASLRLGPDGIVGVADAVARCRRLLDLDADPVAVDRALGGDHFLAASVARRRGVRVPGTVEGFELAVRAVVGQQVSLAAARTLLARIVAAHGTPVPAGTEEPTTAFPTSDALADANLAGVGLTAARAAAVRALARAHSAGALCLEPHADRAETRARLRAISGIGESTVEYIAMRALADPDAFPGTDLVLRRALAQLGASAERWRPWRAYAAMHLWERASATGAPSPERGA